MRSRATRRLHVTLPRSRVLRSFPRIFEEKGDFSQSITKQEVTQPSLQNLYCVTLSCRSYVIILLTDGVSALARVTSCLLKKPTVSENEIVTAFSFSGKSVTSSSLFFGLRNKMRQQSKTALESHLYQKDKNTENVIFHMILFNKEIFYSLLVVSSISKHYSLTRYSEAIFINHLYFD